MNIEKLIHQPEGKTLEFKREVNSADAVLKTVIAFANTAGGILVVGVEDKTRYIKGISQPHLLEERLANLISDSIYPQIIPNIEIISVGKNYLLIIQIYPSPTRPHFLKKLGNEEGVYVRVGSTNRRADADLLNELRRFTQVGSFDEQPIPELDSEAIDFIVASELFSDHRPLLKSKDLETLNLMTHYHGRLVPTVAGILLFGKNREKYFPDAWVQAGRFKGTTRTHIVDSIEIHSYPIIAIEKAMDFIKKHTNKSLDIKNIRHREVWTIPLIALREAIINAIVHADYSLKGSPMRISIFEDRIEIENPGLIPFNLTFEDLYQGISKLRNRVLGRIFYELGLIERWGSGIQRMFESCTQAGLAQPQLEEVGTHFRVTFFTQQQEEIITTPMEKYIMNLLDKHEGLTTQQIANAIQRSTRGTRLRLLIMLEKGLIIEHGTSSNDPNKKYFVKENF